jgi:site-specific DNA-methyltransferase (adenine-specific)
VSEAVVFNCSGANLSFVKSGAASLVFTGPPFFDDAIEAMLREPRERQRKTVEVERCLKDYALSLQPVFNEVARVLSDKGTIVLHTKDIRYGNSLIPLAYWHEEMLRGLGFLPLTKIYWLPKARPRKSGKINDRAPVVGDFRAKELELFSVFRAISLPVRKRGGSQVGVGAPWLAEPIWLTDDDTSPDRHRHAAPPAVLERLLELYSLPGDLVIDPFCGGGGFLDVARKMGRDAVGTEISLREYERCLRRLSLGEQK